MTVISSSEVPRTESASLSDSFTGAIRTVLENVASAVMSGTFIARGFLPGIRDRIALGKDPDVCGKESE